MSGTTKGKSKSNGGSAFSNFAVEGARVLATGLLTGVGVKLGSNLVEKALSSPTRLKVENQKLFKSFKS